MTDKPDRQTAETMAKLGQERQATQTAENIDMRLRMWAIEQAVKFASGPGYHGDEAPADMARDIFGFLTEKPCGNEKA